MKLIRFATNALSTKKWGSNTPISPASLPTWAGALFSCRLSSFWQSAGLQNHRPLVRIHPHENQNFLQTENRQRISTLAGFLWARVDYASRASKKAPQGLFSPPDCSAGRCCSNPPLRVKLKMPDKTKNQRNFYAGLFMGAGGFEPPKLKSSRFTVCPHWPLGNTPISYFQSSLTACIFYHLKWHLSTTFSTDFLFFCRSLFSCVLSQ